MDEVSSAQTPWQSLATETNSVSVSAVPLEKSSSSPLGSYKVQGIQAEKDLFFLFLTPYTVIVHLLYITALLKVWIPRM